MDGLIQVVSSQQWVGRYTITTCSHNMVNVIVFIENLRNSESCLKELLLFRWLKSNYSVVLEQMNHLWSWRTDYYENMSNAVL